MNDYPIVSADSIPWVRVKGSETTFLRVLGSTYKWWHFQLSNYTFAMCFFFSIYNKRSTDINSKHHCNSVCIYKTDFLPPGTQSYCQLPQIQFPIKIRSWNQRRSSCHWWWCWWRIYWIWINWRSSIKTICYWKISNRSWTTEKTRKKCYPRSSRAWILIYKFNFEIFEKIQKTKRAS